MLSKFPHPDHWVVDDLVLSWAPVSDVKVGDMRGPLLADPSPRRRLLQAAASLLPGNWSYPGKNRVKYEYQD